MSNFRSSNYLYYYQLC